jgi:hypothetical protein
MLGKPELRRTFALMTFSFLTCINKLLASNYETLRQALHSAPTAAIGQHEALTWIDHHFPDESQHFDLELIDVLPKPTSVGLGHGQPFHVLDELIDIVQPTHHRLIREQQEPIDLFSEWQNGGNAKVPDTIEQFARSTAVTDLGVGSAFGAFVKSAT